MTKHLNLTIPTSKDTTISTLVTIPSQPTTKPAVLFLHFWGGSSRTWHLIHPPLSGITHCIAPSLRGWGKSSGPADNHAYSIPHYAADTVALLTQLHAREDCAGILEQGLVLVGHSMGGKIAQYLITSGALRRARVAVTGLVLLAPAPLSSVRLPTAEMREQQRDAYQSRESAELVVRNVLLGRPGVEEEEEVKELARDAVEGNRYAKVAWPLYGMEEDHSGLLADRMPWGGVKVIVLVGENDRVENVERVRSEVVEKLDGVHSTPFELRVLGGGCGHLIPIEQSREVAAAITQLLT